MTTYKEIFSEIDAAMLQDADDAITACNLWDWLKDYTPDEGKGFMFDDHPNTEMISNTLKYAGHSGSSFAWTMRVMHRIAKYGRDTFFNDMKK